MGCPKSRIEHQTEKVTNPNTGEQTTSNLATAIFQHHKNEQRHGREVVPLAPELAEAMRLLEEAAQVLGGEDCPTLFFRESQEGPCPFTDEESSHHSIALLSTLVDQHVTSRYVGAGNGVGARVAMQQVGMHVCVYACMQ